MQLRENRRELSPPVFDALFRTTDAIADAGERLRSGRSLEGAPLEAVLTRLAELVEGDRPSASVVADAPGTPSIRGPTSGAVRVAAEKLDEVLARSGELLVAHRRLNERAEQMTALEALAISDPSALAVAVGRAAAASRDDARVIGRAASQVDEAVRRLRLVPFSQACQGFDRVVRDLAEATGKAAQLVIEGGAVEIDRAVAEGLRDPLLHAVRNAIDHGVEPPAERAAAGKTPRARVTIIASLRAGDVAVEVGDDGRGLDLEALRAQLRRRGLPEPADDEELTRTVFLPGLSTARLVTDLSGRGVGLDVVRQRVEALRGTLELTHARGAFTRLTIVVPLTLTSLRVLLVRAGDQTFAVPASAVKRVARIDHGEVRVVGGIESIRFEGATVPVAPISSALGFAALPSPLSKKLAIVLLSDRGHEAAVAVDELVEETTVLVKSLGRRLGVVKGVSGATLLADGAIALIVSPPELIARTRGGRVGGQVRLTAAVAPNVRKRVVLADDSVTTRLLEKSILESAGYDVVAAVDGAEAWDILVRQGADVVVSDVEMPRMDGFTLAETIRASPRFRDMPIVLVTGLANERDRARGLAVGASAYLVKSSFDQAHLLETLAQLV